MGSIQRRVMKFFVPKSLTALKTNDLTDREVIPFYINPTRFNISNTKIVQNQQTKGGFLVQYWGEELTKLEVSGTTASGGIEAIHVLYNVYRHEQTQFRQLLLDRAVELSRNAEEEFINSQASATPLDGVTAALDEILNGSFTSITDGVSSTIDSILNVFNGISDRSVKVELIPTLASFAVSIDLYFQGEKYRGYFDSFSFEEDGGSPGIFTYNFSFTVLKKYGLRKNFMPWHRTPVDGAGKPITASIPIEGSMVNELTFPTSNSVGQGNIVGDRFTSSEFISTQDGLVLDINNVGISRMNKAK